MNIDFSKINVFNNLNLYPQVADFSLSQNRLIRNLQQQVKASEKYLLDGHYCLLNSNFKPEKIDFETFELLDPFAFSIVVDEVQDIKIKA